MIKKGKYWAYFEGAFSIDHHTEESSAPRRFIKKIVYHLKEPSSFCCYIHLKKLSVTTLVFRIWRCESRRRKGKGAESLTLANHLMSGVERSESREPKKVTEALVH